MARIYIDRRDRRHDVARVFVIDFHGLDGRRHRERTTATTRTEAMALLRQKMSEVTRAKLAGVSSESGLKPVTFNEFLKVEYLPYSEANHTKTTHKGYKHVLNALRSVFGTMPLRSITPADVQRYFDAQAIRLDNRKRKNMATAQKVAPATANRHLMVAKSVFSEAKHRGFIDHSPAADISPLPENNTKCRFLTATEEAKLLAASPDWLRPIILTALHTGGRLGELLSLAWADIDSETKLIRFEKTKSHKTRYVPINTVLAEVIKTIPHVIADGDPVPWVFPSTRERKEQFKDVKHAIGRAAKAAGLVGVGAHVLRHTFASRLVQAGEPILTVSKLLGHSDVKTTMRYAHLAASDLHAAVQKLANQAQVGTPVAQTGATG